MGFQRTITGHKRCLEATVLRKAAFFDRDGTINVDFGHVYRPQDLQFIPGTPEIIRKYNDEATPVLVVTNQAGIAKGLYTEAQMHQFHAHMNNQLLRKWGAKIDGFYFCPHHPDYTGPCCCRKPAPGMLFQAAMEWDIDLAASIMYGDTASDQEAAEKAGIGAFVWIE